MVHSGTMMPPTTATTLAPANQPDWISSLDGTRCTGLLRRALSNLLSNATRYARPDSTVIVEIQSKVGQVEVWVCNIGPEITPAEITRIFDRFYRADVSRSDAANNHGLGLSIVSAIARMHGGHTLARSGQGETCIGLALPLEGVGP